MTKIKDAIEDQKELDAMDTDFGYTPKLTQEQIDALNAPLPKWALSENPFKKVGAGKTATSIHPMAVIDRLNLVFGVGGWQFTAHEVAHEKDDKRWIAASKGSLIVPESDIRIEQFGGSDNTDLGDAYKGSATDALTKCGSYLGIGASIYKGKGNLGAEGHNQPEWARIRNAYTNDGIITPDDYESCDSTQKYVINEIKKSKQALKNKDK